MIRGIYTAAAGMAAEQARQDVLANNLANLNTSGFKRDLAIFKARQDQTVYRVEAAGPRAAGSTVQRMGDLATGAYLDQVVTRYSQGGLRSTENPFDLAISGEGFVVVRGKGDEEFLTRGGSFQRDARGRLVDAGGRELLGQGGAITLNATDAVHIDPDGRVTQGNRVLDRLRTVAVTDPDTTLVKVGESAWRVQDPAGLIEGRPAQLLQGFLEGSNVNPVREMVEMIAAQRSYEASQKMIHAEDETLAKAVSDLGRV